MLQTQHIVLPAQQTTENDHYSQIDNQASGNHEVVTIEQMKKTLNDEDWELDASASPNEIEEIYEAYVLKKKLASVTSGLGDVTFPTLPANFIENFDGQQEIKTICNLEFCAGGRFISN